MAETPLGPQEKGLADFFESLFGPNQRRPLQLELKSPLVYGGAAPGDEALMMDAVSHHARNAMNAPGAEYPLRGGARISSERLVRGVEDLPFSANVEFRQPTEGGMSADWISGLFRGIEPPAPAPSPPPMPRPRPPQGEPLRGRFEGYPFLFPSERNMK